MRKSNVVTFYFTIFLLMFNFIGNVKASDDFYFTSELDEYLTTGVLLTNFDDKYEKVFRQSKYLVIKSNSLKKTIRLPINFSYQGGDDLWASGVIPLAEDWVVLGTNTKKGKILKSTTPLEHFESFSSNYQSSSFLGGNKQGRGEATELPQDKTVYSFKQHCNNNMIHINSKLKYKNRNQFIITTKDTEDTEDTKDGSFINQYYGKWKDRIQLSCYNQSRVNVLVRIF